MCVSVHGCAPVDVQGNSLSLDGFGFFRSCRLQGQHNLIADLNSPYPIPAPPLWLPSPAICAAATPASILGYSLAPSSCPGGVLPAASLLCL